MSKAFTFVSSSISHDCHYLCKNPLRCQKSRYWTTSIKGQEISKHDMKLYRALLAVLLVVGIRVAVLHAARMRCENNECPENHCCLSVGKKLVCTPLRTLGQSCQHIAESTDNPEENQTRTYVGKCPCAEGLFCEAGSNSASRSSREESSESSSSEEHGTCQNIHIEIVNLGMTEEPTVYNDI
ncbi:uncharacterized protein [Periplaneta americana]|uniref:uncharacterized protein n=1 Tax=Periplaneta americana TaxID=6978 RepID=UPI0037E8158D